MSIEPETPPNRFSSTELTNLSAQIAALVRQEVQRQVSNNPSTSNINVDPITTSTAPTPVTVTSPTPVTVTSPSQNGVNQQQQTSLGIGINNQVQPDLMAGTSPASPNFNFLPPQQTLPPFLNPGSSAYQSSLLNPVSSAYQLNNKSESSQHLAHMHPAIQPAQLQKIKKREYIDFNLLLPDSSLTPGSYSIQVDPACSATTLSLVPRTAHNKITDFFSWLLAWNNFMRTYIFYHPEMAPQLLYYQSMICQYAQQYLFEEVYTFDRSFRIRVANGKEFGLRWDRFDQELVARYLRTFKPACYKCNKFGHYANACTISSLTTHSSNNFIRQPQPFRAPQRQSNQPVQQPSQPPYRFSQNHQASQNRTTVCYYFNQFGQCDKPNCSYPHSCKFCHGPHGKAFCPGRSKRQ